MRGVHPANPLPVPPPRAPLPMQTADVQFSYMPRNTSLFLTPPRPKTAAAAVVWVASNCAMGEGAVSRAKRVARLMELMAAWSGQVDSYGACLNNKPWPKPPPTPLAGSVKMAVLSTYKFTLAFENSRATGPLNPTLPHTPHCATFNSLNNTCCGPPQAMSLRSSTSRSSLALSLSSAPSQPADAPPVPRRFA